MKETEFFKIIGMIHEDLIIEANKEAKIMKHSRFKIGALIAAAVITVGVVSTAAGHYLLGFRYVHSSNIPNFTQVPTQEQLEKKIGYSPCVPEEFSNGYKFKSGHITENTDEDTQGNKVAEYKGLVSKYEKDGDSISIYTDTANEQYETKTPAEEFKGVKIYYSTYDNKCFPPDYTLTEQDKKDEAEGKYVFSYGSSEIEIYTVQSLSFNFEGVNYDFCAIDSPLSKAELVEMAKEIIG